MSGWTTITMKADKPADKIKALAETNLGEYDTLTDLDNENKIVINLGGYEREEDAEDIIRRVKPDKAIAISANDTTDSGDGVYYEAEDGKMVEVDYKEGYEAARANDVAGYFNETYGFYGYPRYH